LELKQFILKLSLQSRLCTMLFVAGILLKLAVSFSFSSTYSSNFFLPFVDYFISSGFSNPYQQFAFGSVEIFPYPIFHCYVLILQYFMYLNLG